MPSSRRFRSARALAPLALILAAAPLAGCGGSPTLARIGERVITVADFEDAARGNEAQYAGSPDSARTALLEDLVKRAVLIEQAARLKLVPDSTLERLRRETTDRLAVEALLQKLVPQDPAVSDAEAKAMYDARGQEAQFQLIYALERGDADAAVKAITAGEPFEEVARRYNNPSILPADGALGYRAPGSMVSPLDDWLRDAPPGQLMGPAAAPGNGWFVARVVDRRPRQQEPFEAQKPGLMQMIRTRKVRDLQQKAFTDIKSQYRVALESDGPQALFVRLQGMNESLLKGMGARALPPTPTPEDEQKVVARHEGKGGKPATYTLAEALRDLADPMGGRVDPSSLPMLRQWIEQQVVSRTLKLEAARRRVAEEPAVARRIRENLNNLLLQQVYGTQIAPRVTSPTEADVRAAFERHAHQLVRLDQAKVLAVTLDDSAAAVGLAGSPAPEGFRQRASGVAGARLAEQDLRFPNDDLTWQNLQAALMGANPGDVRGPFRTPQGWLVFQLESKQQVQQALESLEAQFRHALEQEAAEMARDRVLTQYSDSLRKAFGAQVFPARLKRVPWPVPREKAS